MSVKSPSNDGFNNEEEEERNRTLDIAMVIFAFFGVVLLFAGLLHEDDPPLLPYSSTPAIQAMLSPQNESTKQIELLEQQIEAEEARSKQLEQDQITAEQELLKAETGDSEEEGNDTIQDTTSDDLYNSWEDVGVDSDEANFQRVQNDKATLAMTLGTGIAMSWAANQAKDNANKMIRTRQENWFTDDILSQQERDDRLQMLENADLQARKIWADIDMDAWDSVVAKVDELEGRGRQFKDFLFLSRSENTELNPEGYEKYNYLRIVDDLNQWDDLEATIEDGKIIVNDVEIGAILNSGETSRHDDASGEIGVWEIDHIDIMEEIPQKQLMLTPLELYELRKELQATDIPEKWQWKNMESRFEKIDKDHDYFNPFGNKPPEPASSGLNFLEHHHSFTTDEGTMRRFCIETGHNQWLENVGDGPMFDVVEKITINAHGRPHNVLSDKATLEAADETDLVEIKETDANGEITTVDEELFEGRLIPDDNGDVVIRNEPYAHRPDLANQALRILKAKNGDDAYAMELDMIEDPTTGFQLQYEHFKYALENDEQGVQRLMELDPMFEYRSNWEFSDHMYYISFLGVGVIALGWFAILCLGKIFWEKRCISSSGNVICSGSRAANLGRCYAPGCCGPCEDKCKRCCFRYGQANANNE